MNLFLFSLSRLKYDVKILEIGAALRNKFVEGRVSSFFFSIQNQLVESFMIDFMKSIIINLHRKSCYIRTHIFDGRRIFNRCNLHADRSGS